MCWEVADHIHLPRGLSLLPLLLTPTALPLHVDDPGKWNVGQATSATCLASVIGILLMRNSAENSVCVACRRIPHQLSSVIFGAPNVSPAVSNHPEILHRRRICAVPTHWLPPTAHLSRSVIPINKSASIRCSCLSERAMHGPIIRAERPPCRPHHSSQRCPINISGARRTGLVSSPAISPVSSAMVAMLASLYFCFCAQKFVLVGESEFGVFEYASSFRSREQQNTA